MSILRMSISGAVMILAIIMIRAFAVNKLPKKTFLVLWGAALVRLLIPYSIPSALSLYSLMEKLAKLRTAAPEASPLRIVEAPSVQAVPVMESAQNTASQMAVSAFFRNPWQAVWFTGTAVLAIFFSVSYVKFRREFRESLPVENETARAWLDAHRLRRSIAVRYSDRISAPLTFGVFHPVILVPKTLGWPDAGCAEGDISFIQDIFFILEHEYVHIVRFDAVTKLVLAAVLCIHWFNPFVWGMYILANRDIELSCDEAVVRRFGEDSKSAYAGILIRMEETKSGLAPLYNNFSKNAMEERIVAIMKIKKYTIPTVTAAVVLVASVLTVFATSAADTSVSVQQAGTADDQREEYEKHLEKKTEVDLMKEENIKSAHAEITYNEPADSQTAADEAESAGAGAQSVVQISQAIDGPASIFRMAHDDGSGRLEDSYSSEDLAEYASFGLVIKNGSFYYKDKKVRNLVDEFDVADGVATRTMYTSEEGSVDVRTVRQPTKNADGSIDPAGKITALEMEEIAPGSGPAQTAEAATIWKPVDAQEIAFGSDPIQTSEATAVQSSDTGEDFMEFFSPAGKYGKFGIRFEKNEVYGNIYYQGRLVNVLIDRSPDGGYMSVHSTDKGGINLKTVYDAGGTLTGVEIVEDEHGW